MIKTEMSRVQQLETLVGRLVVSCQAYPGEPMRSPETMVRIAKAAIEGGAAGIRLEGVEDIRAGAVLPVPVIGIWKHGEDGVFITPTLKHALAVAEAGADIVAIDGTRRARPDGLTLAQTIERLKDGADVLVMADCGSIADALAAQDAGADILGTTLAGYTGERELTEGPDLEFIRQLKDVSQRPIMAEGRMRTPADAAAALAAGATSVCVGTAITHPTTITAWFVDALAAQAEGRTQ